MATTKRVLSSILVAFLLTQQFTPTLQNIPHAEAAEAVQTTDLTTPVLSSGQGTASPSGDWDTVDWDGKVRLLEDTYQAEEERARYRSAGNYQAMNAVRAPEIPAHDERAMEAFNVPVAVREAVTSYYSESGATASTGTTLFSTPGTKT